MARKPAPTKAHPDAKSSKPATATEHPALTLFHALNALHTVCSNAGAFRELAERRERARAMQLNFLNIGAKIASDRANELARAGAPREQQWAALTEGMDRANDPPPSNEPDEYTKSLRGNVLDHGRTWCERARAAMRAGGAKGLDAATHPNAAGQARSIELHTKLQDAERVFVGLTIGVGDPRIIIDKDAASMADLGAWFASTRDELGAVFETRGLDAPAPTPTVSVSPDLLERLQRAAAAVDPGAIDRAAERAAEKIARVFGAGDNGHTKPPALPAGVALTTDHESILAVLGKTPTKCKTVIDVSSAGTIRNRETVGRLLGELEGFGMVDRPHGKRKGYALTDAGRKRLPGATPT